MSHRDNPSDYNNTFMYVVGLCSAVLSVGVCWGLTAWHQFPAGPYDGVVLLVLGFAAFVIFSNFRLLISARQVMWMLGQATLRWFRLLLVVLALSFFFAQDSVDLGQMRTVLLEWVLISLPLQLLLIVLLRKVAYYINNSLSNRRKAVFIGMGPGARKLLIRLLRSPILGIEVSGYYADRPFDLGADGADLNKVAYLGTHADACRDIVADDYSAVFVSVTNAEYTDQIKALIQRFYDATGSIYFTLEMPLVDDFSVHGAEIAGVPLLTVHESQLLGLSRYLKRGMDLLIGGVALILLSPVLAVIAIAVKLDSPGTVLFRQKRYGERGLPITVYKFRSMRSDAPQGQNGKLEQAKAHDARVTRTGRFLRKTSLDELPQLFNVIQGTMSLVGPRPHAAEHNEYYRRLIPGYMLRHTIKPGITGWAQVNGLRGETDTPEKMHQRVLFDRYYIMNWSLWLDVRILFRTVFVVLLGKNAY